MVSSRCDQQLVVVVTVWQLIFGFRAWYYLQPPSCRRGPARFNLHCIVPRIRRIRTHLQRVELPLELCKGVNSGTVRANDIKRY